MAPLKPIARRWVKKEERLKVGGAAAFPIGALTHHLFSFVSREFVYLALNNSWTLTQFILYSIINHQVVVDPRPHKNTTTNKTTINS
jgi:uncharacterized cupin superfamily protein